MQSKLIEYIEKILVEVADSVDLWYDVYSPMIKDAYEKEYDKSIFNHFIEKINQYNDQDKVYVLEVILSYDDPSNFDSVLNKFKHLKDKEVVITIIDYLRWWSLTEDQKQRLNEFYKNSGIQSRFGDAFINELNKKK
jgi:hypothetical protein